MHKTTGFTLVELMIASALIVILLTSALPSMLSMINQHQVAGELNEMRRALAIARQHAIDTQVSTSVCAKDLSKSTISCGTNWNAEKIVFSDVNRNGLYDGKDELLYNTSSTAVGFSLSSTQNLYTFVNNGTLLQDDTGDSGYATLKLCDKSKEKALSRALFVYPWGKVSLSQDNNKDGIYEGPDAKALSCA